MTIRLAGSRVLDDVVLGSARTVASAYTVGGRLVASTRHDQRWLFEVTLEIDVNGRRGLTAPRWAHRLNQGVLPFELDAPPVPGVSKPTGTYAMVGARSRRDGSLTIRRTSGDGDSGEVEPFSWFNIAGQSKLYVAVSGAVVTDAAAGVPLLVFPPLRSAAAAGAVLDFDSPTARVVYTPQSVVRLRLSRGVDQPTFGLEEFLG